MKKILLLATVSLVFVAFITPAFAKTPTSMVIELTDAQLGAIEKGDKAVDIKPTKEQVELAKVELKLPEKPVESKWTVTKKHVFDGKVQVQRTSSGDFISISHDPDIY